MIQKTTKIVCDNCGQGLYDITGNPPRDYTIFAKHKGWVVKYINGSRKVFCDEECYKEWKGKYLYCSALGLDLCEKLYGSMNKKR